MCHVDSAEHGILVILSMCTAYSHFSLNHSADKKRRRVFCACKCTDSDICHRLSCLQECEIGYQCLILGSRPDWILDWWPKIIITILSQSVRVTSNFYLYVTFWIVYSHHLFKWPYSIPFKRFYSSIFCMLEHFWRFTGSGVEPNSVELTHIEKFVLMKK